jgi:hypothetical protein
MNDEFEGLWKEVVVTYFKILWQHFSGNSRKILGYSMSRSRFKPDTSRVQFRSVCIGSILLHIKLLLLYCTMFAVLDPIWSPIVPCYSTEDTVRIVNSFITIPITRNYNHNYFLRCYAFTQLYSLHVHNYNHVLHSCTGWLLSYHLLSRIITHFTS